LDAATGKALHVFKGAADGCIGGGTWTSPTIDEAAGTIYAATGTKDGCYIYEQYAMSLLELRASDLSVIQYWQVPKRERVKDGDFGATPTLFTTSTGVPMVGMDNKNGLYYAFKRGDLSHPVWQTRLATRMGTISSSAWDGHRLYVGARRFTANGVNCLESVVALDPDTGKIIWRHCQPSEGLIGAISAVPGLVIFGEAGEVVILDATSGQSLFTYIGKRKKGVISLFRGWASVSHGALYIGGTDGNLYAFGLPTSAGTH
jgi:outer membrane protein assembly factor BamB